MKSFKEIRIAKGISQIRLAYGTKIGRYRLYLIENGFEVPSDTEIKKISSFISSYPKVRKK